MRIDPVVALTLMLFSIIIAATSVSMSWGYALGRSALRGVTQPDVRLPSIAQSGASVTPPETTNIPGEAADVNANADADANAATDTDMVFWSEPVILEDVKTRIGY